MPGLGDFVVGLGLIIFAFSIVPNLIALLVLSPVIFRITREYFTGLKNLKG